MDGQLFPCAIAGLDGDCLTVTEANTVEGLTFYVEENGGVRMVALSRYQLMRLRQVITDFLEPQQQEG